VLEELPYGPDCFQRLTFKKAKVALKDALHLHGFWD
jgi:hypothetical protein